jgi:hypothetical protein
MSVRLLSAVFIALSVPSLSAAQSTGHALSGAGTISCGQYLEFSSEKELSKMVGTWTQGFLSGMNLAGASSANRSFVILPDSPSIKVYLDKYCREHPLESPVKGAIQLFMELRSQSQ